MARLEFNVFTHDFEGLSDCGVSLSRTNEAVAGVLAGVDCCNFSSKGEVGGRYTESFESNSTLFFLSSSSYRLILESSSLSATRLR